MKLADEFSKFHNLTTLSSPPDTTKRSLLDKNTDLTKLLCYPIIKLFDKFCKFHSLTALSQPPDMTNFSLREIHTELTAS